MTQSPEAAGAVAAIYLTEYLRSLMLKAERAAGNSKDPTSRKGMVYEPVRSYSKPANRTLAKPPTWWNRKVTPEMVPKARTPYTSAVSVLVSGAVATHENPATEAKSHNPRSPDSTGTPRRPGSLRIKYPAPRIK